MKIWKATAMLMLVFLAVVPIGCDDEDDPAGVGDFFENVSLQGGWTLRYTWRSDPRSPTNPAVYLIGDTGGEFSSEGAVGTWSLNGSMFTMVFSGGVTVYTGQLAESGNSISGTMTNSEYNDSGTFTMVRDN